MTPHRAWFDKYTPHSVPVCVVDGTVVRSTGIGSVNFGPVLQGSEVRVVMFHQVLHLPALQNNLLSVLYLTRMKDFQVLINNQSMQFERHGILLFTASLQGNLAYLDGTTLCSPSQSALASSSSLSLLPLTLDLWHHHLSHINIDAVK